ncbi:MAG: endolytic transglycosylase MltG [Bacteroidales bacterium]|nr:endolytic transglycosylase MltG [Bacteroidales bacterium]MDD3860237.1 endolytic transglycosylase MltG [Bacteroidales bacterium]
MSKKKKVFLIILIIIVVISIVGFVFGNKYYGYIFRSNVKLETSPAYLYIPNGSDYEDVLRILDSTGYVVDIESFKFVAERKNYQSKVLAGRYEIFDGMSNNELVNLLRSGKQSPVKLTFISVRSLDILAGKVSVFIEADSVEIVELLHNPATIEKYGFSSQTFMAMFIPNTYEFYWNTSAEKFVERMAEEFKKFWTDERLEKASNIGITQTEVSILASIIEQETQKNDEKPRLAGVYINRLNKGMLLQACPTVIYAMGDFSIQRVLNRHLTYDSPYNTYIHQGLPPGPICIPSVSSIDAVLNYEKHNYMFFCAKDDFSGYHVFSVTNAQHEANSRKYHQALQKAGIR